MKLHDLHPKPGAHQPSRRVGRGHGSGRGKTAGRGTKGQRARAGGGIQPWFEGGQTPIHVRTPKLHGFKNRFRVEYAAVNLARISDAKKGTLITPDVLEHDGVIRDTSLPVKILGGGEAPAGVTIHAHAFSKSARDKLEAAGSSFQQISWPDGQPVEQAASSETDGATPPEVAPEPANVTASALADETSADTATVDENTAAETTANDATDESESES